MQYKRQNKDKDKDKNKGKDKDENIDFDQMLYNNSVLDQYTIEDTTKRKQDKTNTKTKQK